jgi:hypothetical protein
MTSNAPTFVPAGAGHRHDPRPADMPPADVERVRIVAARVASSSHSAKFQMELIERTRHNHHFLFLDPTHPWHQYYQYCLHHFNNYTPEQWQQHNRAEADATRLERERRAAQEAASTLVPTVGA